MTEEHVFTNPRRRTIVSPRSSRRLGWLVIGAIAVAFLAVPAVVRAPGQLVAGCARWIVLAGALELFSILGFVVVFKLVFAPQRSWSESVAAGLRAVGATTIVPAGGLIGPAIGARTAGSEHPSPAASARSAIAFALVTNVPEAVVVVAVGVTLWLGWLAGPSGAALTLLPAGGASVALTAAWLVSRRWTPNQERQVARSSNRCAAPITAAMQTVPGGIREGWQLLAAGNWKLVGAVGYWAFDNAALWAAFRAYGPAPPLSVVMMGYLVGSLATALPLPAGLGAVEGGLIGALVLYGARPAPAAAAVLLYRGVTLLLPVILSAFGWALLAHPERRLLGLRTRSRQHA